MGTLVHRCGELYTKLYRDIPLFIHTVCTIYTQICVDNLEVFDNMWISVYGVEDKIVNSAAKQVTLLVIKVYA